ncbi:hypothetical protein [Actinacidiphila acidipaludis]|uniref:Uncharacterized protein n=1 Tax=Actinacidiphila acidipaludis TaxID=2873382 RepID=A0ABS7QEN0_9ACTN|nr:hypothetical protein [Streptomyces acidipaludis]MBY8881418.1 hypothetical protein [Streptomyces acidipaludis]
MERPTGGRQRAEAVARGCGITALVAAGLVCLLVLIALWQLHRAWDRKPPDIDAFAHAAATRTADAAAARTSSAQLAELTSALPWAAPLGTSVADSCRTENESALFGAARWAPVNCVRSTVVYVAFDGDLRTRVHQLDATLAARRWVGATSLENSLTAMTARIGQTAGAPSPAGPQQRSTEAPTPPPLCVSAGYRPSSQNYGMAHGGLGVRLRVAVAERPCTPEADTGDIQVGGTTEKYTVDGTVYLTWHPLATLTVSRSAHVMHRYVAAFSLVDSYAVQSTTPRTAPPAPPTTRYGVPPCLTGSHACH